MFIRQLNHFTNSFIYNLNGLNISILTQKLSQILSLFWAVLWAKVGEISMELEGLVRCSTNYVPLTPISFLERAAKAYRDTTSVVNGSVKYTWGDMHERCLKIASALNQLGISRGDVVSWFFWFCSCFIDLISAFDHCF